MDADVIVIGAGVAGLAAAGELARNGSTVRVLEARARIGGRVFSTAPRGWGVPVELGAEFVHGGNGPLDTLLREGRIETYPVSEDMWWRRDGRLQHVPDFWRRITSVTEAIPPGAEGRSFAEFLQGRGRVLPEEDRWLAKHYTASFNAAQVDHLSAAATGENHAGADATDFKLRRRYARVAEELRRRWPAERVELRLRSEVVSVRWHRGDVTVTTRATDTLTDTLETHRARAVVVTLPLGVLKAGDVTFVPALEEKQALIKRLGWGQVVRLTFRFRPDFWKLVPAHVRGNGERFTGYLNAPGEAFPVWWALTPEPILTAWAGGEEADMVVGMSPAWQLRAAVNSLASILETTPQAVRAQLSGWRTHDWHNDPYTLGGYSFPVAGLEDGAAQLAKPHEDTVFFAGEATADDIGTVHGALQSGLRTAEEIKAVKEVSHWKAVG